METVWDQQYLDSSLLVHVKVNLSAAHGSRSRTKLPKSLGRAMHISDSSQMGAVIFYRMRASKN